MDFGLSKITHFQGNKPDENLKKFWVNLCSGDEKWFFYRRPPNKNPKKLCWKKGAQGELPHRLIRWSYWPESWILNAQSSIGTRNVCSKKTEFLIWYLPVQRKIPKRGITCIYYLQHFLIITRALNWSSVKSRYNWEAKCVYFILFP